MRLAHLTALSHLFQGVDMPELKFFTNPETEQTRHLDKYFITRCTLVCIRDRVAYGKLQP